MCEKYGSAGNMIDTVIIGIGSPILSDGAAPLEIVELLRKKNSKGNLKFSSFPAGGFDLLTELAEHEKAVIIAAFPDRDEGAAMMTETVVTGGVSGENGATALPGDHGVDLAEVLQLGRTCGYSLPGETIILGIHGAEVHIVSERQSDAVVETVKKITQRVEELLDQWDTC